MKGLFHKGLRRFGYTLTRIPPESDPPALFNDPLEALYYQQGGKPASYYCPINQIVGYPAFGYGETRWSPFAMTLLEYQSRPSSSYKDSILHRYYSLHQPDSAAEVVLGFDSAPRRLHNYPPHLFRLTPWTAFTPTEISNAVKKWTNRDNEEHGRPDLNLDEHGHNYYGPVHPDKGKLEYTRLIRIYKSLKVNGYDRVHGDVNCHLLIRNDEYLLICKGPGVHRVAAAAALGLKAIPSCFTSIIDIEMVDYWPQVRNGLWDRESALAYFNHLFDFESRAWAREQGLLANGSPEAL